MGKRFIHISDLHIGITLKGRNLIEDIRYVLEKEIAGRILEQAAAEKPVDAVIIAGDIFDRGTTTPEGEQLFGDFLRIVSGKGIKIYCTAGNHDSAVRISSYQEFLSKSGVFVPLPFSAAAPFRIEKLGNISIVMLPFITMTAVKGAYPETVDTIKDTQEAVRYVLDKAHDAIGEQGSLCILVAHQAVGRCVGTELGRQTMISPEVFDGFTYTALGHFHSGSNPEKNERVRYCGSPLCYSLNEAKKTTHGACLDNGSVGGVSQIISEKTVDVIDVEDDGSVSVSHIPVCPQHRVITLKGAFEDIMEYSDSNDCSGDYYYIIFNNTNLPSDFMNQIIRKFPLLLDCVTEAQEIAAEELHGGEIRTDSFREDFGRFFREKTGENAEDELLDAADFIFELTKSAAVEGTAALDRLINRNPALNEEELRTEKENDY